MCGVVSVWYRVWYGVFWCWCVVWSVLIHTANPTDHTTNIRHHHQPSVVSTPDEHTTVAMDSTPLSASSSFSPKKEGSPYSRSDFLHILLKKYDNRVPPNFDGGNTTEVECNIYISSFDSISESTMDYMVSIFIREEWRDPRLSFGNLSNDDVITLDSRLAEQLWLPDLYFTNEKEAHFHYVTVPNRYVRIYRNGTVYHSARVSLTLSCPMKLHKFPLDTQVCSMQFESYAYTTDKLLFRWRPVDPVELSTNLALPQFDLEGFSTQDCTKTYSTGAFTCLQADFRLTRSVGFYLIQTYIPSALIVMLSWVSFWINVDAIPARISLGVLTILTMTTQSSGARQQLPRVSYIKAIDVWMATCLLFVFAALLEFAIVNVLSRNEVRRLVTMRRNMRPPPAGGDGGDSEDSGGNYRTRYNRNNEYSNGKLKQEKFIRDPDGKHKARTVDKVSRRLFPVVFFLFNVVYWIVYSFWSQED